MKLHLSLAIILLGLCFSCTKDPFEEPEEMILENSVGISDFELETLDYINELRAEGSVCGSDEFQPTDPVFWNDVLDKASEMHANDMMENNFISHVGSDGSLPTDRLEKVEYNYIYSGENVAKGPPTVAMAMEAFMESPTHCAVLMSPHYTHVGIAKVGTYWVLNFAKPRS